MILNFMTEWGKDMSEHLAGKPTYFIEKIISSLREEPIDESITNYFNSKFYNPLINIMDINPKHHTIRFMTPERAKQWEGKIIDFYVDSRTKDALRFAPRVPVTSVQQINIYHAQVQAGKYGSKCSTVYCSVGNINEWGCHDKVDKLAINDGFKNWEDFFAYFNQSRIEAKEKEGKFPYIIHWTDLKY